MMSGKPRRNPRRGSRSQSCFELQGSQFLHASLSCTSLPPRTHRPPSQSSLHSHDPQSSFRTLVPRVDGSYKPTTASRLRACSAPVARTQPDYRHMARRRKESILAEKTLTAEETLNTALPEGETLHSFLVGGRYNSAHHVDVRSLQRLGVYVPRNSSVKTFINPAGTLPPSPAVYGVHPLRKHLPLLVGSSSTHSADRGPALVKQYLDMQLNEEVTASKHSFTASKHSLTASKHSLTASKHSLTASKHSLTASKHSLTASGHSLTASGHSLTASKHSLTASKHSLTASGHSLHSKHSTTLVTEEDNRSKPEDAIKEPTNTDYDREDTNLSLKLCPTEKDCTDVQAADEDTASSVVSASNLLSPEAQQLTREILLETESVSGDGHNTTTAAAVAEKTKSLSINPVGRSKVGNTSRQILVLQSHSATSLRHTTSQQMSSKRPQSAFQQSTIEYSDSHNNSGIFVDLSKLNQPNSADYQ